MRSAPLLRRLACLALVAGCSADGPLAAGLAATTWHLQGIDGAGPSMPVVVSTRPPTIAFTPDRHDPSAGTARGFTGCNRFQGRYRLSVGGRIEFGGVSSTYIACGPSETALEVAIQHLFDDASRWEIGRDTLTIVAQDAVAFRFGPVGRRYALESVDGAPLPVAVTNDLWIHAETLLLRRDGWAVFATTVSADPAAAPSMLLVAYAESGDSITFRPGIMCVTAPCPNPSPTVGRHDGTTLTLNRFADLPAAGYRYLRLPPD